MSKSRFSVGSTLGNGRWDEEEHPRGKDGRFTSGGGYNHPADATPEQRQAFEDLMEGRKGATFTKTMSERDRSFHVRGAADHTKDVNGKDWSGYHKEQLALADKYGYDKRIISVPAQNGREVTLHPEHVRMYDERERKQEAIATKAFPKARLENVQSAVGVFRKQNGYVTNSYGHFYKGVVKADVGEYLSSLNKELKKKGLIKNDREFALYIRKTAPGYLYKLPRHGIV